MPNRLAMRCCLAFFLLLATSGAGIAQGFFGPQKASLQVVADRSSYAAGETAQVAALISVDPGWHVNSNTPSLPNLIPTELTLELPEGWELLDVSYPQGVMKTFSFDDRPLSVYDDQFLIRAAVAIPDNALRAREEIFVSLLYQACDDRVCVAPNTAEATLELDIGEAGQAINADLFSLPLNSGPGTNPTPVRGGRLAGILLLALLGGLILNAMPCVLPILSLKIFGLVQSATEGRKSVIAGSLATAVGILVSFLALALAAVAAKAAGSAVGWGIQFQNPLFVTFLTVVIVLFCLNLWGLFEIQLPQQLARAGGGGSQEGLSGHFITGLFATLMATPCSAPFLGTAMGFALGQTAPVILAVFLAVGLGMSLPYLFLAAFPGAAQWIPKPGAWMDVLRGAMGFLLAAAAVWLLYVLAAQITTERLAFIQLALLVLALFLWLRHKGRAGSGLRKFALVGALVAMVAPMVLAYQAPQASAKGLGEAARLITWTAFDPQKAESLATAGTLVFVDVTADWCFTCKVNENLVLETQEIADLFEEHQVVAMKADWTNRDQAIGDYLASFERYGIPFYALYRPQGEAHVFSELLTKDAVIEKVLESKVSAQALH